MFDILIKGGLIIDGTGTPGYYGAVAVAGDSLWILQCDTSSVPAGKIIDATGQVVCPGFIDMHAHSGLMVLANPRHEPKVFQGITTELIGIDGNSYAPFPSYEDLGKFIRLNSGLDGAPKIPQRWLSVEEYLSLFDVAASCNFAYVIGNSAIRISAMGWEDRSPTRDEMCKMKTLLRQGMEEGAYGISTGLDYPPGSYACTDELVELCKEAKKLDGIYHTHVRYGLGDRFLDPFKEAIQIGRRSGIPAHITHFYQRMPARGSAQTQLALVDQAHDDGLDVTFDSYPYPYSSTRLIIILPQWAKKGGPDALLRVLRSPKCRKRLEEEVSPRAPTWDDMRLTNFNQPGNQRWEGHSITEVVRASGKSLIDTLCDLLIEEDLQISYVAASGNPDTIPMFYQHPLAMVGTDALLIGKFPSPRSYGTFPYILGEFVREKGFLTLADSIRKMTEAPAQRLGLRRRGVLLDGFKADIVVFDPTTIKSMATHNNPRQYPVGIDYVIVNGVVVADHGVHTGAMPGKALRRGQA